MSPEVSESSNKIFWRKSGTIQTENDRIDILSINRDHRFNLIGKVDIYLNRNRRHSGNERQRRWWIRTNVHCLTIRYERYCNLDIEKQNQSYWMGKNVVQINFEGEPHIFMFITLLELRSCVILPAFETQPKPPHIIIEIKPSNAINIWTFAVLNINKLDKAFVHIWAGNGCV